MEKGWRVLLGVVVVGVVGGGVWRLGVIQNIGKWRAQKAGPAEQSKVVQAPAAAANGSGAASETAAPDGNVAGPGVAPSVTGNPPFPGAKEKKGANAGDFHTAGPTPELVSKDAEKVAAGAEACKRPDKAAGK